MSSQHVFTGCDTVSAFAGKGKVTPLKLASKNEKYISAFTSLGSQLEVSNELVKILEEFTCELYHRGT